MSLPVGRPPMVGPGRRSERRTDGRPSHGGGVVPIRVDPRGGGPGAVDAAAGPFGARPGIAPPPAPRRDAGDGRALNAG